jgi:hypothetical protein
MHTFLDCLTNLWLQLPGRPLGEAHHNLQYPPHNFTGMLFFFLSILGLELRAYTLSHSTSLFL